MTVGFQAFITRIEYYMVAPGKMQNAIYVNVMYELSIMGKTALQILKILSSSNKLLIPRFRTEVMKSYEVKSLQASLGNVEFPKFRKLQKRPKQL